jgi:mycoredoxin-dependent peroxiredoxin
MGLNFPLLSDFPNYATTRAYGTFVEGRSVSRRVTYVVDKEGVIQAEVVSDMDMARHSQEALEKVRELEGIS